MTQNIWVLDFRDLTAAQKTALQTYFNDVAKGPSNTFSYTHTDSTTYSGVRFMDNVLEFSRIDGGAFFSCQIRLLIAAEVNA
jgi:alkyl sulfatase BDS1-like metallo-beta-lactamase superfamily hydrolase